MQRRRLFFNMSLVNGNILSFVTISNITRYYPLTITTRAYTQPVTIVFCTRATAIVTSHCSHSSTSPTSLPLLHRYRVAMMFYYNKWLSRCWMVGFEKKLQFLICYYCSSSSKSSFILRMNASASGVRSSTKALSQ